MHDLSHLRVLVTAVEANSVGGQIVRALAEIPGPPQVFACDASRYSEGLYRPSLAGAEVIPSADDPAYVDGLASLCRRWGIDALFVGSEPENPGSVEQPRDGDPTPAWAILDSATREVRFWSTPYDHRSVMRELEERNWDRRSILSLGKDYKGPLRFDAGPIRHVF